MLLKHTYASESEVPAEAKQWYAEEDGKWILQVEGVVPAARLNEFRANNRALHDKLKLFEGLDPEKCRDLIAREAELEEGKVIKKEGVEAAIKARLDKVNEEHAKAVKALEARAAQAEARLEVMVIDRHVMDAAIEHGLHRNAVGDFMAARVRTCWKLIDGKPVAVDQDGNERYGAQGQPLQVKEWLAEQSKAAPHFFAQNTGTGANGSQNRTGSAYDGKNPWMKGQLNLTLQHQITKENAQLAARLKAAAQGAHHVTV